MDEFLSIEDLRWEFGASRAWMYKYLAPHIKSITVKCSTDDGERLCKRYSLDDARRVVAEKARAEVYSVPVKADPGGSVEKVGVASDPKRVGPASRNLEHS